MLDKTTSLELLDDPNFMSVIRESSEFLFNHENSVTLYDKNNIILKGIIFDAPTKRAFYISKEEDRYSLYESVIHSYVVNKHTDIKSILTYTFSYNGFNQDSKLTFYGVDSILYWEEKTLFEAMNSSKLKFDIMPKEKLKDIINTLVSNKEYTPRITSSLYILKEYFSLLTSLGFQHDVTDDKLISYTEKSCKEYEPKIKDIVIKFKFLKTLEQFDENNKFDFNDLDNYIWIKDDLIIIDDQNVIHICDYKNDDNLTIYFIIKDDIPSNEDDDLYLEKFIKNIKTNQQSVISNCVLIFEDGKITYISTDMYYCFDLDITYGVSALESELDLDYMSISDVDVDIRSVKYMRDYFYTMYDYDRFKFCNHVFLTLGSGIDYDSKTGSYQYYGIQYREDIKECPLTSSDGYLYGLFNDYTKIFYLSDEWKQELTWFYNCLLDIDKKGKELQVICKGHNNDVSIKQVINSIKPFVT